jgi:hypothetical protein
MSHYADKHPHEPPCAVTTCEEPGTAILSIQGRLGWFCDTHKEMAQMNGERPM